MNVFAAAIDDLFADPYLARAATYRAGGTGPGVAVSVILKRPDDVESVFDTNVATDAIVIDVRASEVAAPSEGDTFTIGLEVLVVQGKPLRDRDRLVWRLDTRPG